ncbi:MarR family winged helix-turn-helix transcriptional regulator [Actinoallomurus iriomotensis]|uniref:MarR family transcriptional regulator n=1 Tax=Actinoallomurus iriomotensis TaxID=478107 RepID=A0A9W6RLU8_9ACTN|nr:MarR family transcriptional regulator [Actinoallomurus iriomotensis]GLY78581.1 MarR family transcriptional regulator [Actinoallomurus iriomotensis]
MPPTDSPSRDDLDVLLRRYSVEADRIGRAFCERHGMHRTDFQALGIVMDAERRGAPITPAGLARALSMTTGAVSAAIDRLERTGHLRRSRESADRRLVHLHYTPEGMALARDFFLPLGERAAEVRSHFSAEELDTVARYLAKMNAALGEHHRSLAATRPTT